MNNNSENIDPAYKYFLYLTAASFIISMLIFFGLDNELSEIKRTVIRHALLSAIVFAYTAVIIIDNKKIIAFFEKNPSEARG